MHPDEAIAKVASRQHAAFTVAQALTAGFSKDAVLRRKRSGRWRAAHRGVLILAGSVPTREQAVMAGLLSYGPRAVASALTSAVLLGIWESGARTIHVTLPYGEHRRRRLGFEVHQAQLTRADIKHVANIPVTGPNRTLVDLAALLDERGLESALDDAIQLGLTTIPVLRRYIKDRRLGHNAGIAALQTLLADRAEGAMQKALERMFRRKLEATDLPRPKRQFPIGPYKTDFAWPDRKIVVELDGLGGHFSAQRARRDKRRDRAIVLAGFTPMHFAWEDVEDDWPSVEADLRAVLGLD